jgi:alpha-beta hydrolase superfamily lysophospholipase
MNVDFVRFKATDDVELQGWLSNCSGEIAAIHIHGMAGNGYQNKFLDNLREMYTKAGISFLTFDNRGAGIMNDFRLHDGWKQGGSCYEVFEESIEDIRGAIEFMKALGKTKFILQGHSLGGSKLVNYLVNDSSDDVLSAILLAPTDMTAWAASDPEHEANLAKAERLLAAGNGSELVGAQCWPLDKTPLSAQAYSSKSKAGSPVDIYGEREGGSILSKLSTPTLIVYGSEDIGITHPFGSIEAYRARLDKVKNQNTNLVVIDGAPHSYRDHEQQLAEIVEKFVSEIVHQ